MSDTGETVPRYVVTRKVGEVIRLGETVWVRVEKIYPDRVLLEVVAPNTMPVHRSEVYAAIRGKILARTES